MVYSDFRLPSENMKKSQREINEMIREQQANLIQEEQAKLDREAAERDRYMEERATYVNEYVNGKLAGYKSRTAFLEDVKSSMLSEAMFKLYLESYVGPITKRDKAVAKNLISKFVQEQGVGDLLGRFKYQNTLVAEMGRIVRESYNKVVDSINEAQEEKHAPGEVKEYKLDKTIVDDFYKDLVDLDTVEASKLIRDKVSDAISEFIDQNTQNKLDYEEIIDAAKDKVQTMTEESAIESVMSEAKRQINIKKNARQKNVFHYVVEGITKSAYKNEAIGKQFFNESAAGGINMDAVVNSAQIIYTMLEMINTTEMVDTDYIKTYVESLVTEV